MKLLLLLVVLLAVIKADPFDDMKACIALKCPDQYAKCMKASGCEDKLRKCADKCGLKVDKTCWTFCIGLPGAAANAASCAVNQKCIESSSKLDSIGLNIMSAIDNIRTQ